MTAIQIVSYSASPSGILCIELIKQSPSCQGVLHPQGRSPQSSRPQFSHSKTIQNLSLLVGFLDWILLSTTPTSDVCSKIRGIITSVLDQILELTPSRAESSVSGTRNALIYEQMPSETVASEQELAQDEYMNVGDLQSVGFGLDLLDTYSWLDDLDFV
jgi:hypothetical protein